MLHNRMGNWLPWLEIVGYTTRSKMKLLLCRLRKREREREREREKDREGVERKSCEALLVAWLKKTKAH